MIEGVGVAPCAVGGSGAAVAGSRLNHSRIVAESTPAGAAVAEAGRTRVTRCGHGRVFAVPSGERCRVERLCVAMEGELRRIGGEELLADARLEADWYAALYFYWDGTDVEPLVRMRARADILSMRLERAREVDGDSG